MKIAKLKKLLLRARAVARASRERFDKISEEATAADKELKSSKEELKKSRKRHKSARKEFREKKKALKAGKTEIRRATKSLVRLENKWAALSKKKDQLKPSQKKTATRARRAPKERATIKVVAPADVLATSSRTG